MYEWIEPDDCPFQPTFKYDLQATCTKVTHRKYFWLFHPSSGLASTLNPVHHISYRTNFFVVQILKVLETFNQFHNVNINFFACLSLFTSSNFSTKSTTNSAYTPFYFYLSLTFYLLVVLFNFTVDCPASTPCILSPTYTRYTHLPTTRVTISRPVCYWKTRP